MNKESCEYYELEFDDITYIGEEVGRRVMIGERCNHESYSGVCLPNSCTLHSDMKAIPDCPHCQHGFYAQRQKKWMCEYPNEEEEKCKLGHRNYYKDRWSTLEPEFTPEFITEEEMKI